MTPLTCLRKTPQTTKYGMSPGLALPMGRKKRIEPTPSYYVGPEIPAIKAIGTDYCR